MKALTKTLGALLPVVALALPGALGHPQEPPASPAAIEHFEKRVRPLLLSRCASCHGDTKQFASLRVDSRAALLRGGDHGPSVVPGDPAKSRLLDAVHQSGSLKMPPDGKLSVAEIDALVRWVKEGAPWPGDAPEARTPEQRIAEQRRALWSLQPVGRPAVPAVRNTSWPVNAIDRFVLAALERKGLSPAPPAGKATLLRRVTFDLIGLPPTPEEVDAFVADPDPKAYEKRVDRLLASTHYGERWGRQWLDVARYSDTLGYLVGLTGRRYPYAYTYRDYVIRALNADRPYDRFVVEQLAADQIPLTDRRDLAALGFLTVGNRYLGDVQEILDDRIDVVGRGLQGLTIGCARCHTHKFDPIPIEDYYSLYAVFNNSHEPERPPQIDTPRDRAALSDYRTRLAALEARRADALAKKDNGQADNIRREILDFQATHPGAPPCAMVLEDNEKPTPQRVFLRGVAGSPGAEVPRRYLLAVAGEDRKNFEKGSGRLELARTIASPDNPLTARVLVNRIWLGHFGKGLVRTPSDFGTRGEPPTHPELLDWLARSFMDSGWSMKALHRRIVLSRTYRQSADPAPATLKADPDNRLLGRMNRRRLDFEQLRDAMLHVSGTLDARLFGQPVEDVEKSRRRTLYTFQDRQSLPVLWRAFDFPDPNQHAPQRSNTTVPQQSLFLLNNPFVQEMARALAARRDVAAAPTARARAARMLFLVTGRPARPDETQIAARFVARLKASPPTVLEAAVSPWQYGYGALDPSTHHLRGFTAMPKFTGSAWQGGDTLPDKAIGWATLNAGGGHPGDAQHAAVRRWVAPRALTVSIAGAVTHPSPGGNGIRAAICHNGREVLLTKTVAHGSADMAVARVTVRQGDTIDFVVDQNGDTTSDSFAWAPVIEPVAQGAADAKAWSAAEEFGGPVVPAVPPTPWEVYAQALLLTNDFLYVD